MSNFQFPEKGDISTIRFIYGVSPVKNVKRESGREQEEEDIETMLKFWRTNLAAFGKFKRRLVFTAREVEKEFAVEGYNASYGAREEYIPGHLPQTLEELVKRQEVVTSAGLRAWYKAEHPSPSSSSSSSSSSSPAAAASLPISLLTNIGHGLFFGVSRLTSSVFQPQAQTQSGAATSSLVSGTDEQGFISVSLLRLLEDAVLGLARQREQRDLVFFSVSSGKPCDDTLSLRSFLLEVAASNCSEDLGELLRQLTEEDIEVLIFFLVKKGTLLVSGRVVKIVTTKPCALLPEDLSRITLRASIANIDRQLEITKQEIDACEAKAHAHCRDKQKALGLYALEKRKRAVERMDELSRKYMILDRALDGTQQGIHSAEMNRLVQEAYISAASGLRSIARTSDVTPESFEDAKEAFEEELAHLNDVTEIVSRINDLSLEERDELERQLDDFLAEPAPFSPPDPAPKSPSKAAQPPRPDTQLPQVSSSPIHVVRSAAIVEEPARQEHLA